MTAVIERFLGALGARALTGSGRLARGAQADGDAERLAAERRAAIESGRLVRPVGRGRQLPFDVLLTRAGGALPLFRAGPFDELRFFQRVVGPGQAHDVEYLVRLDPRHLGTERFAPFGVARLRADRAAPLPDPRDPRGALTAACRAAGLSALPTAAALLGGRTTAFDPDRGGAPRDGENRVVAAASPAVLDLLRRLEGPTLVGFFEAAFVRAPGDDRTLHRYYLDAALRAWVVRDHAREGKRLLAVEGSAARARGLLVYTNLAA